MHHLQSRYNRFIQTEEYLNLSCVRDTGEKVLGFLGEIEAAIGRDTYSRVESAIINALDAQEMAGFMVGYMYAIPVHKRKGAVA